MEWSDIWKIVVTSVTSLGGIGVIIYFIIRFSAEKIAERLEKKYELKLEKNLEIFKSELDTKSYISKAKFDKELNIYVEISESLLLAVDMCFWLFPTCIDKVYSDPELAKELYNKRYLSANESVIKLQNLLGSKAPFISEELYDDFLEIKKLLVIQINMYDFCGALQRDKFSFNETKSKEEMESWKRTEEISNKYKDIVKKMRNYLNKIENINDT